MPTTPVFLPISGQARTLGQSWQPASGWGRPSLQQRLVLLGEGLLVSGPVRP